MPSQRPRFGLLLPNRGVVIGATTVPEMVQLAEAAEAAGWDSVWVGDSVLAKPRLDALVLLGALAVRTSRVRLGVACMASTPLRDALLLAYQWNSLDVMSGGRMIFVACQGGGPGSGEFENELRAFHVERGSRMRRMEEAIEILRLVSSQEHVSYQGQYYQFEDVTVLPRSVQQPLPIWLAANPDLSKPRNVERAYRRVARYADGWQTTHATPEEVRTSLELIRGYAAELGRALPPDFEACVAYNINVQDSREAAYAEAKRFLDTHSQTEYSREFLEKWVAMGSPAECAATLRRLIEAGATSIVLRLSSFDQQGQFRRVTEEILPLLA